MFRQKLLLIGQELRNHAPFTILGAVGGILFLLLFRNMDNHITRTFFAIAHPAHVFLSAMVTAALFELHRRVRNFLLILLVGICGSIGVATLSDSILPFFGETILGVAVPTHASLHEHDHAESLPEETEDIHEHADVHEHPSAGRPDLHLGFIEEWYLVFPAAFFGVLLAYFRPRTKLPHASHVLLSTWASASHMLMNTHADMSLVLLLGMLIVLFLSVWLPCCFSDIVFPLLFVRSGEVHVGHTCILCGHKDKHKD